MTFTMEIDQEENGRWIAEVLELPGVLTYGQSPAEAKAKVQALALRVMADHLDHGEAGPNLVSISFAAARVPGPARERDASWRCCCVWAGVSNGRRGPFASFHATDGRTPFLPPTTWKRSVHACSPGLPSVHGFNSKTCSGGTTTISTMSREWIRLPTASVPT